MKTLKLWVHTRTYNDNGDDIRINAKEFPDVKIGDVLELYHPEDEYSRLLLQVVTLSEEFQQKDTVSIEQSIASQFQLRAYKDVIVSKVNPKDVAVDLVELLFKDQYLSRSDMWRLRHGLVNTCAYLTKKIEAAEMRVQVNELWAKGERVTCGMITEDTRIVFRSSTAVVQIYIQMSSEMWQFDINGDLYFEKAVNGFLTDLFAKWKEQNCLHDVTIVLFSRTFYEAQCKEEFPAYMRDCLQQDYQGRFYEDYYRVVVQNERYDVWAKTIKTLRKLFNEYPKRVVNYHQRKGQRIPKARNSTAAQGNFLETLNMSLNLLERYYIDRNFDRTGKVAVVITPGPGVFEVDRELANITKQRTIDCGVGSDLVCMGEQPLHAAPLFKFHTKTKKALHVGDDYNIPHWMNHSFYLSKNQIQAKLRGSFVPRIHPPAPLTKEKKTKMNDSDFTKYSSCDSDDDNFPFIDYDEYDAQVFKLPVPNVPILGPERSVPKVRKQIPQTFSEMKKERQMRGRIRCSSDDMSVSVKSDKKSVAISIPSRSSSGDEISTSVPNMGNLHPTVESSEDESAASEFICGSDGTSSHLLKNVKPKSVARRALINPFAPSSMHFRMTSNRRRWIHAFPTDPHGAAVQTHHFHTYKERQQGNNWTTPTKEVLQATQIAVEARRQRSVTRQDSFDGSEGTSFDQSAVIPESGESSSPSLSYVTHHLGSSVGSGSYTLEMGRMPAMKRLLKEGQRSWLWGPTGEQEWTPEMTTGQDWRPLETKKSDMNKSALVKPLLTADSHSQNFCAGISVDWKSLTIPATLPITTDYFPDKKSLQMDFVFNDYTLIPDAMTEGIGPEENFFKRTPLTPKQVFKELISQRLSQGFQVIVSSSSPAILNTQTSLSSSPQYQHTVGLIRARPRKEHSEECFLSIGRIFHKLTLTGPTITVTRYRPRHPGVEMRAAYCYRFQAPDSQCYDVSWSEFKNEKLENYNWNYLDQYICTRGEGDYGLMESLKFWRSRFIILPCNNPATKKIMDGHNRCDIYEERTAAELQQLTNGFVRFLEILNKIKKTAKRTKLSGDQATSAATVSSDSSSGKATPAAADTNTVHMMKNGETLNCNSPTAKLVEAMMEPVSGLPILTNQPGIPANSFIACEAVTWCKSNIQGVNSVQKAVDLMQRLVDDHHIVHASGNFDHQFLYGFYFYYFTQIKEKSKDTNFHGGQYSLFQKDFCEVSILPVEEEDAQQPNFHLDDLPEKPSLTSVNPENDDWRTKTGKIVGDQPWGQQSATLLHKYVNVDVDVNDKSDRPEWATARYHAYYSPMCGFQLQLQWMVSTGSLLGELVYSWARKATSCGCHILPVPTDPFALPFGLDSDSLRGPIFIPLNYVCLTDLGMPLFGDEKHTFKKLLYDFQLSIIKRYGFMSAGVSDLSESTSRVCHGDDYSHFVHCTAGMFVMIEDSQITSPSAKESQFTNSLGKKSSSELRKDYIKFQQLSQPPEMTVEFPPETENKIGFLWSWNFMSSKRWRSTNTGDEAFQDKMFADFRKFCNNDDNRLQEYWLEWFSQGG